MLGRVLVVVYENDPDEEGNRGGFAGGVGTRDMGGMDSSGGGGEGTEMETDDQLRMNFAYEVLWKKPRIPRSQDVSTSTISKEGIPSNQPNGTVSAVPSGKDPLSQASKSGGKIDEDELEVVPPSLADRIFSCVVDLLFCAGFTVPETLKGTAGDKINVGSEQASASL